MNNSDSFVLDGVRLIKTDSTSTYYLYQSERGNIMAKGYYLGNTMRYFEVFYPNGNSGVFGYTLNYSQNYLYYPLMSLNDLKGNKITYSYTFSNNNFRISNISYNGASVEFKYNENRPDTLLTYKAGMKIVVSELLQQVVCKLGNSVLRTYILNYSAQNGISLLTSIDYSCDNMTFNPLRFYYGDGLTAAYFTSSSTQLYEWYESEVAGALRVVKGKFDYDSGSDGLISLPNLNPYWKHYRHSTALRHSQNRFVNKYSGDEKIFLYAGLKGDWAYPMPDLLTEAGFVDILCGDLAGKQEEYIVKVNNSVVNSNDRVTFKVYRSSLYSGLSHLYTRTYDFSTIYTDADGGKSIQPKFYYTGDFDGDGKMEVLAVSTHQPFGDVTKPSHCYIFDLNEGTLLYQSHVMSYHVDFVGTQQSSQQTATNNSDKLYVMDFDGDGKTDICHIHDAGTDIYTFDFNDGALTARLVATYTGLKNLDLVNKVLYIGEFNGDGLTDFLATPQSGSSYGGAWTLYTSKGNGQFESSTFTGPTWNSNTGFLIQDINADGKSDLISYNQNSFFAYLCFNRKFNSSPTFVSFPSSKSNLVPTDINSHNHFNQLIGLHNGVATKYSFSRDDSKELLATGMANSLGVVEKNEYRHINEESSIFGFYDTGYGAAFPYVNIREQIPVLAASETYLNGDKIDENSFTYENAVIHRQGLGFCGFGEITAYNSKGQAFVREFDPYHFGLLSSERSPFTERNNTFVVNVAANRVANVQLRQSISKDLITGGVDTVYYMYDSYGYPTTEFNMHSGGIWDVTTNTYAHQPTVGNGYNLGFIKRRDRTFHRGESTYSERMLVPVHSLRLPTVVVQYKDGHQVKQTVYSYDAHGNKVSEKVSPYSSTNELTTFYSYDTHGQLTEVTDPLGRTQKYSYDSIGRLSAKEDYRGGITIFYYDSFGRPISSIFPDGSVQSEQYFWSSSLSGGIYAVTTSLTGKPTVMTFYDALNRVVRSSEKRFDESVTSIDRQYDEYGRLKKVSDPFKGDMPLRWNTYGYDAYDRIRSYKEASGRVTNYSYSENSITTTRDNISTTRTYDAHGNLVSATDPAGTIIYDLSADEQISSIKTPGDVTTTYTYDEYRRQVGMNDPGFGTVTREYDNMGNISRESFANGNSEQYEYDDFGRLLRSVSVDQTSNYAYNEIGELTAVSNSNGTSRFFTYDDYGNLSTYRENGKDGKWLQKDYTYSNGNISSVTYTSHSGILATEDYYYSNGHLSEVKLNDTIQIYKLNSENAFGQPAEVSTGKIKRKCDYTPSGVLSGQSAMDSVSWTEFQNISYDYDVQTSNLLTKTDSLRSYTESFGYDNMNRLVSFANETVTYDVKGNITSKSDIGSYDYGLSSKPYAVTGVASLSSEIPTTVQEVIYNSFNRPMYIIEGECVASFDYNDDHERVKMSIEDGNGPPVLTRYYLGDCYELDQTPSNTIEKLYLMGDYYTAPSVLIKQGDSISVYNILRDHLGSVTHVINSNGVIVQELAYDAWGRQRNPATQEVYSIGQEPELFLGRGFTGHEHLPWLGLINMNARLYDPALGRFLSPDPVILELDNSQSYNSYTYCLNNPLCYVDPMGLWNTMPFLSELGELLTMVKLRNIDVIKYVKGYEINLLPKDYSGYNSENKTWVSPQGIGNGVAGGWGNVFGGSIGNGTGSNTAQFRQTPNYGPRYNEVLDQSPIHSNSLNIGVKDVNSLLAIEIGYKEDEFNHLKTGAKSKLVYDFNKKLKNATGIKLKNNRDIYKRVIPKFFKWSGIVLSSVDYAFTLNTVIDNRALSASDFLNLGITTVALFSPHGWFVAGVFFGADLLVNSVMGNDIGYYLNELIDDKLGFDNGALINW